MLCRITISLACFTFSVSTTYSQTQSQSKEPDYWHNRNVLERMGTSNLTSGNIPTLTKNTAEIKGDVYLTNYFSPSVFRLYKNEQIVEGLDAKLDIKKNEFDVRTANGIMALDGAKVKDLVMQDSLTKENRFFINAKDFPTENGAPLLGFYEIISSGSVPLVKHNKLVVKTDYHPTLIQGGKEFSYIHKSQYYFIDKGIVKEIPPKKKRIEMFQSMTNEMVEFIKNNKIDLGKDHHVIVAFDYYNKLLSESNK